MGSSLSKSRRSSWSRPHESSSSSRRDESVYPASQSSDNEAEVRLDGPDQSLAALESAVDDVVRLADGADGSTAATSMPDKDLDDLLTALEVVLRSLKARCMPRELHLKAEEELRKAMSALAGEVLHKMELWDMSPVAEFVRRLRRHEPAAPGPDHGFYELCMGSATAAGFYNGWADVHSASPRSSSSSSSSADVHLQHRGPTDESDKSLCRKGVLLLGDGDTVPMLSITSSVHHLNRIVRCFVDADLHRNLCSLSDQHRHRLGRCFDSHNDSWLSETSSASFGNSEDVSEKSICGWILAFKVSVKVLRLMWQQFLEEGDSSGELAEVKQTYFTAVAEVPVRRFLATARAFTKAEWPADKMSPMLLLMEAFDDILPQQLPKLLPSGSEEMKLILQKMKGVVGRVFDEMKMYISRNPVIHGPDEEDEVATDDSIHPLTKFVLSCMVLLSIHRKTVDTIFVAPEDDMELESSLANQLKGVIDVWEASLQEYYRREAAEHPALCFINMLNNVHWLSIEGITAEDSLLTSERLIAMHREENTSRVDKLISEYLEECWKPHLSHLNSKVHQTGRGRGHATKLKKFNAAIDATIKIQAAWQVPDSKLRNKIRGEIVKHVVEKYRAFLGQSDGKAEELERMINQLFQARMN